MHFIFTFLYYYLYRVIQSSSTTLKRLLSRSLGAENVKFLHIRLCSRITTFCFGVAFIIFIVDFYKTERTNLNINVN
jgi:hypothetical protein